MTTQDIPNGDEWQDAHLGGAVCRAYAWAATTASEEDDASRGTPHAPVRGVETWRGKAVVADPNFWSTWRQRNRMIYEGPVVVQDQVRQINAEVFVYTARRVSPRSSPSDREYDPNVVVVQFIGAGKLPGSP